MALRSEAQLRRQLIARAELTARLADLADRSEWDSWQFGRNLSASRSLAAAIDDVGEDLDWSFDGPGVVGHSIRLAELERLTASLGQTLRWTSRDLVALEGRPDSDAASLGELTEPLLTGTFHGSFGVHITRPQVDEQLSLTNEGTLFERAVERLLAILRASKTTNAHAEILELLAGLRPTALAGLKKLADYLVDTGSPSYVRWHGEDVLRIDPADAAVIAETVASADAEEDVRQVEGQLVGADVESGTFHIVVPQQTRPIHYRGKADPAATAQLTGLILGTSVLAELTVFVTHSPLLPEPKERFLLTSIEASSS